MARSKRFFETFSNRKSATGGVGFGSRYRKGGFIRGQYKGFVGAAKKARQKAPIRGRTTSKSNLGQIEGIIREEAVKLGIHRKGFGRRAEKRMMAKGRALRFKKPEEESTRFTKTDERTLRQVVKALKYNAGGKTDMDQLDAAVKLIEPEPRERAVESGGSDRMSSQDYVADQGEAAPAQLNIPVGSLPGLTVEDTYGDVPEADLAELQTEEAQPFQNQSRPIDEDFLLKVVGYKNIQKSDPDQYEKIEDDLKEMAQGGDPDGVRQLYPGWTDEDFEELLSRLDSVEIQPGDKETEEVKLAA